MEMFKRGMMGTGWVRASALGLAIAISTVACSDDDTTGPDGDGEGQIEAIVQDDPNSASPSIAGASYSTAAARVFTGTASGNFRVDISADGSTWVQLGSLNGISVALQSSVNETSVHGEQSVPVGTYTRLRLVMSGVSADLAAGSVIGGITLGAAATVMVASGNEVTIEVPIQFQVTADAKTRIEFDLNSENWITESAVTAGTASEASVRSSLAAAVFLDAN